MRPGSSSERRNAVSSMPAGAHTRCATRSWNGDAADPLRDQRQHDVAAVAVGEPLARRRTWPGARRAPRGTARSSRARAPAPSARSRRCRGRRPRRGSRRCPTGARAGARPSRRRRSSGRSPPSTERAVVASSSTPSSIRLTTVSAVSPFEPLAIANRVSMVFEMRLARSASPYALANSGSPSRSTRTAPAKPPRWAMELTASVSDGMAGRTSSGNRSSASWRERVRSAGHPTIEARPTAEGKRASRSGGVLEAAVRRDAAGAGGVGIKSYISARSRRPSP